MEKAKQFGIDAYNAVQTEKLRQTTYSKYYICRKYGGNHYEL